MLIYQDILTSPRLRDFFVLTQRKRQIATVRIRCGVFSGTYIFYSLHIKPIVLRRNIIKTAAPKSSGRTIFPLIYPSIFPLYHFCPKMTHSLCQKLSGSKPLSCNTFNVPNHTQSQTDSAHITIFYKKKYILDVRY